MNLHIIGSGSTGNSYLLQNDKEALIIECGVRFEFIKRALSFNLRKVAGCIITHAHGDHSKQVGEVLKAGITVYASEGTHSDMNTRHHHRSRYLVAGKQSQIGNFKVIGFDIQHEGTQPFGFLIHHPDTGNILFLTDTCYSQYTFPGLNNIIVEANYALDILDENVRSGRAHGALRNRIIESHMSIDTCKDLLRANDLSQVNNIVLIHLSDSNSNADRFQREVEQMTSKNVHVAEKEMIIPFKKTPF